MMNARQTHGTMEAVMMHELDDTPLCKDCRIHVRQHYMMKFFNGFPNWQLDRDEPRLLSLHYYVNRMTKALERRPRKVRDEEREEALKGIAIKDPVGEPRGYSDENIRDIYDVDTYSTLDRKLVNRNRESEGLRPLKSSPSRPLIKNFDPDGAELDRIRRQGLCHDSSTLIDLPTSNPNDSYVGILSTFGMDTEEPEMMSVNRELCNQCPVQAHCLQFALESTNNVNTMLGGVGIKDRFRIRDLISKGLKSTQVNNNYVRGQGYWGIRALNISKLINGKRKIDGKVPTEPEYLGSDDLKPLYDSEGRRTTGE